MAQASVELIDALRQTASRITNKNQNSISAFECGICNQLIQSLIGRPAEKLKSLFRKDDWQSLLNERTESTGTLLQQLQESGLSQSDLHHLENLSDPEVLARMRGVTSGQKDSKQFAAQYLKTWASLLESQLLATLDLPVDIRYLKVAA